MQYGERPYLFACHFVSAIMSAKNNNSSSCGSDCSSNGNNGLFARLSMLEARVAHPEHQSERDALDMWLCEQPTCGGGGSESCRCVCVMLCVSMSRTLGDSVAGRGSAGCNDARVVGCCADPRMTFAFPCCFCLLWLRVTHTVQWFTPVHAHTNRT